MAGANTDAANERLAQTVYGYTAAATATTQRASSTQESTA